MAECQIQIRIPRFFRTGVFLLFIVNDLDNAILLPAWQHKLLTAHPERRQEPFRNRRKSY
jgi:hypothetical protein